MEQIIIQTSLFCLGLRIVSDKGKMLYFLRWPYKAVERKIETYKEKIKKMNGSTMWVDIKGCSISNKQYYNSYKHLYGYTFLKYLLSPIIGCVTCMASVYGILIYLHYLSFDIVELLICCLGAAALNAFAYAIYEKLIKDNSCNN